MSAVFGSDSEFNRISRVLWVRHLQLLRAAAPVTVVEFRDAPSSNTVNGELAKSLDQFTLPFPSEKHSLLVDNVNLQITRTPSFAQYALVGAKSLLIHPQRR